MKNVDRAPRARISTAPLAAICLGLGLAVTGCAEAELGAQMIKSANRAVTPAAQVSAGTSAPRASSDQAFTKSAEPKLIGTIDQNYRTAPELFRATGVAKWDGARTLRGIWIAHPLADRAMRVRIINPATNRAADGALFRRDSRLNGPSLLVSSDAAQAIGLIPGEEQALEIYALERAAVESPLPGAISRTLDDTPPQDAATDPGAEATTTAALPQTHAAPAGSETGAEVEGETAATLSTVEDAAAATPSTAEDAAAGPEVIVETTEQGDAIATVTPESAAPSATRTAAIAPADAPAEETAGGPDPLSEIAAAVERAAPGSTETAIATPEPDPSPEPAAGEVIAAVDPTPAPTPDPTPALTPEPEPEPTAAAPEPAATATPLTRRFLQVGVFGVPENATRLVNDLAARDIPAKAREIKRDDGTSLRRVVAGPFDDAAARDRALGEIKALGISDAVAVKG